MARIKGVYLKGTSLWIETSDGSTFAPPAADLSRWQSETTGTTEERRRAFRERYRSEMAQTIGESSCPAVARLTIDGAGAVLELDLA